MAKRNPKEPFELPELAEIYFQNCVAIKKAKFMLSSGGTIEIGIFRETVLRCTSGVTLICDEAGKATFGTVCKTKDPTGLEWYEDLLRALVQRTN